jgi:hypothetical protein
MKSTIKIPRMVLINVLLSGGIITKAAVSRLKPPLDNIHVIVTGFIGGGSLCTFLSSTIPSFFPAGVAFSSTFSSVFLSVFKGGLSATS